VVLAINVGVGFWTEWRARVAVDALTRLQVHEAVVLRDGRRSLLPSAELVPGDVLLLAEGAAVAADARLIEANELGLDEATLTGESMPVSKSVRAVQEEASRGTAIGDRRSMVFKGTTVARGAGRAVVVATGASTELGRIGELVGSVDHGPTPIERRLDALGRRLVWITLAIAGLVFAIGVLGGRDPWLVFETGLALAIAAVPEGLPVVATITLAIGMWRMARRNAVVRRPPAVEALGSATVICADKTGTLTSGRMAATSLLVAGRRIDVTGGEAASAGGLERDGVAIGADNAPLALALIRSAVLANESRVERTESGWEGVGDPTDLALLYLGLKVGISRDEALAEVPEVARMPFSSRRMLMATFHATRSGASDPLEMHVKGAAWAPTARSR
jgi:Ca2+-transporting ATPase